MERYKITVELEGDASPESFKLVRGMAEVLLDVASVEMALKAGKQAMKVEYLTRKGCPCRDCTGDPLAPTGAKLLAAEECAAEARRQEAGCYFTD